MQEYALQIGGESLLKKFKYFVNLKKKNKIIATT